VQITSALGFVVSVVCAGRFAGQPALIFGGDPVGAALPQGQRRPQAQRCPCRSGFTREGPVRATSITWRPSTAHPAPAPALQLAPASASPGCPATPAPATPHTRSRTPPAIADAVRVLRGPAGRR